MLITLVLSHIIGIGLVNSTSMSFKVFFIQRIYEKQVAAAIYSTLGGDKEMESCFLLTRDTKQFSKNNFAPEVLFLSSILSTQTTSM